MNVDFRRVADGVREVLRAPLLEQRNRHGARAFAWTIGAWAVLPLAFAASLAGLPTPVQAFVVACRCATLLGTASLWGTFVARVLAQNQSALARLVPGQVHAIRLALLTGWATAVAVLWLVTGSVFGFSPGPALVAGAGMAATAVLVRWRSSVGAIASLLPVAVLLAWWASDSDVASTVWAISPAGITVAVLAACAALVAALPSTGGARHVRAHAALRRATPEAPRAPSGASLSTRLAGVAYAAWMRHLLARRDSPPMARLVLGLGPSAHWTVRAAIDAAGLAVGLLLFAADASSRRHSGPSVLALGLLLFMVAARVAHLRAIEWQLQQSVREQAVLMLLPGIPRGAALNRPLATRLTLPLLAAIAFGTIVLEALALVDGSFAGAPGVPPFWPVPPVVALSIAMGLPRLWRPWAVLRIGFALRGSDFAAAVIAPLGLVFLAFQASWRGWLPLWAVVAIYASLLLAWGTWRWRCMALEPAALPASRLTRRA